MDLKDKNALLQCRTRIIKDLDIRIVIDSLLESRVVDENLYERIKNEPTIQDQARQLLDILPYRGPKAFPIFVDVLKEDYEWLADDLEEALTLKTEDVTDEVETDELIDLLNRGGVPSSPSHHIQRQFLRDPEITLKYFPDGVFWFRVGMLEPQKLLNRVKILLEKLNCP
eukprot:03120.XXX_25445_26359_1 [CDS] Oithona nana genome sequencing.